MSIDLTAMTPKDLQKLITEAMREQKRKKKRAPILQVRQKLQRLAKSEGYSIQELFGADISDSGAPSGKPGKRKPGPKAGTSGRKVAPKYKNPENAEQTWTGRGKAPLWFAAYLESGKSRDDLLITE